MSRSKPEKSTDRRRRDQRGSVSIELVILLPALFAVLFVGMQAALYYHARTVAIAAAQEGARAAGAEGGSESRGVNAAQDFIADVGDDALQDPAAAAERTATTATVVIEARSLSVIPGWNPTIRQSATVPIERLTTP